MFNSYPNPCDTCSQCTNTGGCEEWKIRYRYRQKQINAFAKNLAREYRNVKTQKFTYEHPDIIRQYLHDGPCAQCKAAESCETPCPAYWRWWDARMEWMKRRAGV